MAQSRNRTQLSRLHELFVLTDDGRLLNRIDRGRNGSAVAGAEAGNKRSDGYREVRVDCRQLLTHRVVYAMLSGAWPAQQIDHIDGVRNNNRPANLRDASNSINQQNKRCAQANSISGLLGVTVSGSRFIARITLGGRCLHLGSFKSAKDAHVAYVAAKRTMHPGGRL